MKFLLITKSRIGNSVPKPADPPAVFTAANAWNKTRLEDGSFDCVYGFADGRGGVSIVNAATHEDLLRLIRSSPMYHFIDYEIRPLCDLQLLWDLQLKSAREQSAS
jgi:muconolactone delta-isomerase